jgi:hypothetical protein
MAAQLGLGSALLVEGGALPMIPLVEPSDAPLVAVLGWLGHAAPCSAQGPSASAAPDPLPKKRSVWYRVAQEWPRNEKRDDEVRLAPAEQGLAWNAWVTHGPDGPIEDDGEPEFP